MKQLSQKRASNDSSQPERSYIICANYRSGSTLLSTALKNSGVAGHPTEYFIRPAVERQKQKLNLTFDYNAEHARDYCRTLLDHYSTPNLVFGLKIMYPEMSELIRYLRLDPSHGKSTDTELLEAVFPNLQYIYIYRRQKLRQAISLTKSQQSKIWHYKSSSSIRAYSDDLQFDVHRIDRNLEAQIIRCELNWERFFYENNIKPLVIVYEDFVQNYEHTVSRVINFVTGDDKTWAVDEPPYIPTSDEINETWYQLYWEKQGWVADEWIQESLSSNQYGPALLALLDKEREKQPDEIERLNNCNTALSLIHQPLWIKDNISWRSLVHALILKCFHLPRRIFRGVLNSNVPASEASTRYD